MWASGLQNAYCHENPGRQPGFLFLCPSTGLRHGILPSWAARLCSLKAVVFVGWVKCIADPTRYVAGAQIPAAATGQRQA